MARCRCCPSDTFDDEWALIEPLLPIPACQTKRGGRPEKHPRGEIVEREGVRRPSPPLGR